jgi:hypothetical protein
MASLVSQYDRFSDSFCKSLTSHKTIDFKGRVDIPPLFRGWTNLFLSCQLALSVTSFLGTFSTPLRAVPGRMSFLGVAESVAAFGADGRGVVGGGSFVSGLVFAALGAVTAVWLSRGEGLATSGADEVERFGLFGLVILIVRLGLLFGKLTTSWAAIDSWFVGCQRNGFTATIPLTNSFFLLAVFRGRWVRI